MIDAIERRELDRLARAGINRRTRQLFLILARTAYADDGVPNSARSTMRTAALPLLADRMLGAFLDFGEV